jgi:hypothetical protein
MLGYAGDMSELAQAKMAEIAAIQYTDSDVSLHLKDLLESCFVEFGGPAGIAKRLYVEYEGSKPGSQTRVKILDNIMRLLEKFDTGKGSGGEVDIDDEEVAEFEAYLASKASNNGDQ